LKLKRDAAKEAWQRYRRGEITAQQLEAEWRRLETPEALEELRKKDQETRGARKAEAETKLAEAKKREEEACQAADSALEAQAKEAEAKAAELKKKADVDWMAAIECDRSLEEMGPEPEEPATETETTMTITATETGEKETEPPREPRCAAQEMAVNRAQGRFDASMGELLSAQQLIEKKEAIMVNLHAKQVALGRELEQLESEFRGDLFYWKTDSYKRWEAKHAEYQRLWQEYGSLSNEVSKLYQAVYRLRSQVEEANAGLSQAQSELARCMGVGPLEPHAPGPTDATGGLFGSRRGE